MLHDVLTKKLTILLGCVLLTVSCAPPGIYHTVQPGQTLYRIAKTYGVDEDRLARVNGIKDPTQLKVNQKLYIPGVTQLRGVPVTTSATTPSTEPSLPVPGAESNKSRPVTKKAETKKAPAKTTKPDNAASNPVKGLFVWPVKGKLLNRFGTQGQKVYKGIEIDVPNGTTVIAAASGKVIYSGNGIPGYGNLVILEHSDSFFSVYGFNQKNLVKINDFVGQGEKIALSGTPPSGQSARLHFEIRKGKSAVNPILYLP